MSTLLDQLLADGLLISSGVDGVFLRSVRFESVLDAVSALAGRIGAADGPEVLRFPPAMPQASLVRSGYLKASRNCWAQSIASAVVRQVIGGSFAAWRQTSHGQTSRNRAICC